MLLAIITFGLENILCLSENVRELETFQSFGCFFGNSECLHAFGWFLCLTLFSGSSFAIGFSKDPVLSDFFLVLWSALSTATLNHRIISSSISYTSITGFPIPG